MSKAVYTVAPVTRVRVAADPQAEVVAELPSGTEVEVLSRSDAFLQISAWHPLRGRVAGWIHKSFVRENPNTDDAAAAEKPATTPRCHACGGEELVVLTYSDDYGMGRCPRVHTGLLEAIAVKARVCRGCGLVQLCLDAEGRERLENWINRR
jgi:hypothetical protein